MVVILPNNSVSTNFCVWRVYDVVTQVTLMMTHPLSITDQLGAGFTTWQDTQHHTVTRPWSHLKLECPAKTTSELGWGARNPKPTENAASVSSSILVKLGSRGLSQCFSCYWPQSHNGSDSNLEKKLEEGGLHTWWWQWHVHMCRVWPVSVFVIPRAGFLCCIVSCWGQACLLAPAVGAWSTKATEERRPGR